MYRCLNQDRQERDHKVVEIFSEQKIHQTSMPVDKQLMEGELIKMVMKRWVP